MTARVRAPVISSRNHPAHSPATSISYPPPSLSSGRGLDTDSEFEELSAPSDLDDDTSASELNPDSDDDEAIHLTRQSELQKLLEQAKSSKEDADALRNVLDGLRKERDEALKTSRSLRDNVSSLQNQVEASLEDREKTIVSHMTEMSRLRAELQAVRKENDSLSKRQERSASFVRKLEAEKAAEKKTADERYRLLQDEHSSDYAALMDSEATREKLEADKDLLSKELRERHSEVKRLDSELETLRREKEQILRIAQTKAERHYVEKKEAERVSMEKADIEQAVEHYRSQNESLTMKLDLQAQQHAQQARAHADEVKSLSARLRSLTDDLAELRRIDGDRRAMFSQLQKSHQALRSSHDSQQADLEQIREELGATLRQKEELFKRENATSSELKVQSRKLREEQERYGELLGKMEKFKQEKLRTERTMTTEINRLERDKASAMMDAHKYKTRVKRLQLKLANAERSVELSLDKLTATE